MAVCLSGTEAFESEFMAADEEIAAGAELDTSRRERNRVDGLKSLRAKTFGVVKAMSCIKKIVYYDSHFDVDLIPARGV